MKRSEQRGKGAKVADGDVGAPKMPGMTKVVWEWAHTDLGDSIICGVMLAGVFIFIHWFAWQAWAQGW